MPTVNITCAPLPRLLPACLALFLGGCAATLGEPRLTTNADLPTIEVRGPSERTVTMSQLRAGVEVEVAVIVPANATALRAAPLDMAGCGRPDEKGLILFPVVRRGDDMVYCPGCDVGYCPAPGNPDGRSVQAGTHRYTFRWAGEAGRGPSHFARSVASPTEPPIVAPGDYLVTFSTAVSPRGTKSAVQQRKSESSIVIRVIP